MLWTVVLSVKRNVPCGYFAPAREDPDSHQLTLHQRITRLKMKWLTMRYRTTIVICLSTPHINGNRWGQNFGFLTAWSSSTLLVFIGFSNLYHVMLEFLRVRCWAFYFT